MSILNGLNLKKKPTRRGPKRDPVSTSVLGQKAQERGNLLPTLSTQIATPGPTTSTTTTPTTEKPKKKRKPEANLMVRG